MAILKKTLKDAGFDGIFTEVEHTESLGLLNPHHLRTFHLNVSDNAFSFNALHRFLISNIGRYVYSRAQLEEFRINDTIDEIGDIMLYAFLEQVLEAPKLFSRIELLTNGSPKGFGNSGVHLCDLCADPSAPAYQMVFGKSHIAGVLEDAVDEAFAAIEAIRDDKVNELQLVDSAIFKQSFDTEEAEALKRLILPSPNKPALNKAYSIFLGYEIGLAGSTYPQAEYITQLNWKMQQDIKAHIAYIAAKIKAAHMEQYSFYVYTLPLNNAAADKRGIMNSLLEGRIV